MRFLVTGGAGFIGSAVVRALVTARAEAVVNVDRLTYAANLDSLAPVAGNPAYVLEQADVRDAAALRRILSHHQPDTVLHLAAETHVDRSIDAPRAFVETNVVGTYTLLAEALRYWSALPAERAARFRFVHVSTDEVYGSLGATGLFDEASPYQPRSPYAASKAAADHLARAWHHTYRLPVIVTNCSNNYGPYQFPEKLIPLTILNALAGREIAVYGQGENVRDWLHVEDHADALVAVAERGEIGATYLIGGASERRNLDVVQAICDFVDELQPDPSGAGRRDQIRFVPDRPGHDFRYAIDATRVRSELGWAPARNFESGLRDTVRWYVDNADWWQRVRSEVYRGERIGLGQES